MSPFDCPICLEKLTNSIAFTCGHGCCLPCLQASGIKSCPLCRTNITTWSPTPWLDSQNSEQRLEDSEQRLEDSEQRLEDSEQSLEDKYLSRPMVDSRGQILRRAYVEMTSLCTPIVSKLPELIAEHEKLINKENKRYQERLQQLEAEHQQYLEDIQLYSQRNIQKEETNIKVQEYHNQSLTHLATTFLALSIQPTEVLDQAIPVYESKLAGLPSLWPLGISPMRPNKVMAGEHFVFVPCSDREDLHGNKENKGDFVYEYNGDIVMGERKSKLHRDLSVIRIRYCSSGLIYVMRGRRFQCLMCVYDLELNVVREFPFQHAHDFYLDGETPVRVVSSGRYFTTMLNGKRVALTCESINNVEYLDGQLYVYDRLCNKTKQYSALDTDSPTKSRAGNFFVSQSKVHYFTTANNTEIFRQNGHCITVPGKCQIYPGRDNTILCKNGVNITLVEL